MRRRFLAAPSVDKKCRLLPFFSIVHRYIRDAADERKTVNYFDTEYRACLNIVRPSRTIIDKKQLGSADRMLYRRLDSLLSSTSALASILTVLTVSMHLHRAH